MNFLAHAYLSGDNDKILVGNFIGDFVKGKKFHDYDDDIQKGIIIHREIDRYTDTHQVVHHSKSILTEKYRHYSGVIVDIFYDHMLAKNWDDYHNIDLLSYTNQVYDKLLAHEQMLPPRVIQMLEYMIPNNWLYNYSFTEGIQRVLNGMSKRTKFDSKMEHAVEDLKIHFEEFQDDFIKFFPDLVNFVDSLQNKQE